MPIQILFAYILFLPLFAYSYTFALCVCVCVCVCEYAPKNYYEGDKTGNEEIRRKSQILMPVHQLLGAMKELSVIKDELPRYNSWNMWTNNQMCRKQYNSSISWWINNLIFEW